MYKDHILWVHSVVFICKFHCIVIEVSAKNHFNKTFLRRADGWLNWAEQSTGKGKEKLLEKKHA